MKKLLVTASIVLVLLVPLLFSGCDKGSEKTVAQQNIPAGKGFEIYLTRDDVPVSQMEALSHLDIADEPLIAMNDIVTYYSDTHEITLTPQAYERMRQFKVNTFGNSFVVCVDRQPVYWGAFWSSVSSYFYPGILIWVDPLLPWGEHPDSITIRGPCPPENSPSVEDPRSNLAVMYALDGAGKLSPPLVLYTYPEQEETDSAEGFAVYLTQEIITADEMPLLTRVELADEPFISLDDVLSYNWDTHVIELTASAYEKMKQIQIPVAGRGFIVCVDRKPLYWGTLVTPLSSRIFSGVIISEPSFSYQGLPVGSIAFGYSPSAWSRGEDPRSNPVIMESLQKAGKLK